MGSVHPIRPACEHNGGFEIVGTNAFKVICIDCGAQGEHLDSVGHLKPDESPKVGNFGPPDPDYIAAGGVDRYIEPNDRWTYWEDQ